jgi:hypothetical protein
MVRFSECEADGSLGIVQADTTHPAHMLVCIGHGLRLHCSQPGAIIRIGMPSDFPEDPSNVLGQCLENLVTTM